MNQITVVPELNYWINKFIKNSPNRDAALKHPVPLSDFWSCNNSVLNLLFNENFYQEFPQASSSSSSYNPIPYYNYMYSKCQFNLIPDKTLVSRLIIYRNRCDVYVCNDEKYIDVINMSNTRSVPNEWTKYDMATVEQGATISYSNRRYFTTNYPLVEEGVDAPPLPEEPTSEPPFYPPVNIFDIDEVEDVQMLDLLYYYRIGSPVPLSSVDFNSLTSCLAKNIYVYLDFCINDSLRYYNERHKFSSGTRIICEVYEKYVIDFIYRCMQKQYGVVYRESNIVNNKKVEINQDHFIVLKTRREFHTITEQEIQDSKIVKQDEYVPWDRADFSIFKNGTIIKQDVDYRVSIDATDASNPKYIIAFLTSDFSIGEKLLMIWSYLSPYGISQELLVTEPSDAEITNAQDQVFTPHVEIESLL